MTASATPDPVEFARRLLPTEPEQRSPQHKALRELHAALCGCDPTLPLAARQEAIERLVAWIRDPAPPPVASPPAGVRAQHARLGVVLDAIAGSPAWSEAVPRTLASVFAESSAVHLLAEVGVPSDRGLFDETKNRVAQWLLPRARVTEQISDCFLDCFPSARDAEWLGELGPEQLARIVALLPAEAWQPLWRSLRDSVRLIGARVAALGLSEEVRARTGGPSLDESPFYALPRACDALVSGTSSVAALREIAARCLAELEIVHLHLDKSGVSVDLVYRMEVITKGLRRLELLAPLAAGGEEPEVRRQRLPTLLAALVDAELGDRSMQRVMRNSTRLLARKVIERVGTTGEHYITRSRKEWWAMLASASGGGVLTAGTATLKFLIVRAKMPLFIDGLAATADYAGSFLAMQFLGFTLATKQPSMTAAALAAALRNSDAGRRVEEVARMSARVCRSQLAAVVGNVGLVIPATIGIDALCVSIKGEHFLDAETATYVLGTLDVTSWTTIWCAALTGVFLWLSSLGAGWLENWAAFRRLPEGIEQHRLKHVIGPERTRWLAAKFRQHVAGAGGSISLGCLLGLMPILGKGFGLPIDVRHVTLSSGALTFAACALGTSQLGSAASVKAMIGIAVIGILNFGVSFALALWLAMRARAVSRAEQMEVARRLLRFALERPWEFLYPPKGEPGSAAGHETVTSPEP